GLPAPQTAGEPQALAAIEPPLRRGTGTDRGLARADRRGRRQERAAGARDRGMCAAHQGLWRDACARSRQLPQDRGAGDPAGARRPLRADDRDRCRSGGADRRARRPRGRPARPDARRNRGASRATAGGGITVFYSSPEAWQLTSADWPQPKRLATLVQETAPASADA